MGVEYWLVHGRRGLPLSSSSANEMHRSPRLDLRLLCLSSSIHLEHHGHVVGKSSHCLHAFCVQCRLTFCAAISDIPVLRCHDRHVAHLEWHLEGLEGRACSSPSADRNHGSRLSLKGLTARRWTRLSPSSRRTEPSYHLSAASGSRQSKIGFIEFRRGGHCDLLSCCHNLR